MFLKTLKLGQKFTLLLALVFLGGISISGAALSSILSYDAQNQISSKAQILMETVDAVRNYTNTQVTPELTENLDEIFLPQSVPSYSAREVFEQLRTNSAYKEFFYKEATLNPTNLRDKADSFETTIVERFRQNAAIKEARGFRSLPGSELFYIARPLAVKQTSCLECHSTPEVAPVSMVQRYGSTNGFGWQLNEIVGAQIISVPASEVLQSSRRSLVMIMSIVIMAFAIATIVLNYWLNRYIVQPIKRMASTAEAISTGDLDAEFGHTSNDEVGSLAEAFRRMKLSLVMAMQRLERYRLGRRHPEEPR